MTKTLGEACFQADSYNGYSFVWSELSDGDREVYERMAAAVAAQVRAAVPAWQPIEAMPRDGGSYLVAEATGGFVAPHIRGIIHNNPGTKWDMPYGVPVTHYMPMPAAPEAP